MSQKKRPPPGLFGKTLLELLKRAPHGTRTTPSSWRRAATPLAEVKAAWAKADAKERNLLFSVMPADQLKSIFGSLPEGVLKPLDPPLPAPPPAPTGGPPAPILTTSYQNVPYPPAEKDPNWSASFTNGSTIGLTSPPPWEWVSVYDS